MASHHRPQALDLHSYILPSPSPTSCSFIRCQSWPSFSTQTRLEQVEITNIWGQSTPTVWSGGILSNSTSKTVQTEFTRSKQCATHPTGLLAPPLGSPHYGRGPLPLVRFSGGGPDLSLPSLDPMHPADVLALFSAEPRSRIPHPLDVPAQLLQLDKSTHLASRQHR